MRRCCATTPIVRSPNRSVNASWRFSSRRPTRPGSRTTSGFGAVFVNTSNGAVESRWKYRSPARISRRASRCRGGAGIRLHANVNIEYGEWPPCAALDGVVLAYWRVAGDGYLGAVADHTARRLRRDRVQPRWGRHSRRAGVQRQSTGQNSRRTPRLGNRDAISTGRLHVRHPAASRSWAILLGVPARVVVNAVRPLGQMSAALDEQISSVFDVRPRIDTVEGREAIEAALIEHFRGRPT